MGTITQDKADLRSEAYQRRREAKLATPDGGERLRDQFLALRLHTGARVIAGYRPIRTEIDPTPLMSALHAAGHRLTVPVIMGPAQPLVFHEWWPDVAMSEGLFGAEIPDGTEALEPDLLLVPLLAFDPLGHRLGYGGGFYDRSLDQLRAKRRVIAVGVAFAEQQVASLPIEETDEPLDYIVTPDGLIRPARRRR